MNVFGNSQSAPNPYGNPIDKKRIILVVGLIVGVLIVVIFLLMSLNSNSKRDVMTMIARENDLVKITAKTKENIRSGELSKASVEATLLLTSDSASLVAAMRSAYSAKTVDGDITKQETDTKAIDDMKNAALLNKFDTGYRALVRKKVANIISVGQKIKAAERDKRVVKAVETAIKNAQTIDKRMAGLDL